MTKSDLEKLNLLENRLANMVDLQEGMMRELGKSDVPGSSEKQMNYRKAISYVMGNWPNVISKESYEEMYKRVSDDVDKARAEAKVKFEMA